MERERLYAQAFYMERKTALANIFLPHLVIAILRRDWKRAGRGIKEKQTTRETEYDRKMPRACVSSYLSRFT